MCEWGTDVEVENLRAGGNHPEFPLHYRTWKIDACIAPIVKALNEGGVETSQSCCGHGKNEGRIDLVDGRILRLDPQSTQCKHGRTGPHWLPFDERRERGNPELCSGPSLPAVSGEAR